MLLSNFEFNLILTCSANCFIIVNTTDSQVPKFSATETKLYAPVVTLSSNKSVKLVGQLKSAFKKTSN